MKKTLSSKKSAFSLIELSIVLIIIGLLIAGITGGASLIKSSELRSIMGEARGYAVSVNSFFTQYDQYPGDANILVGAGCTDDTASVCKGDRDNKIEFINDNTTNFTEGWDAWRDLKDIGAIDLALATPASLALPAALVPNQHFPGSKIKGAGWLFDYNTDKSQNVVVLSGTTKDSTSANKVLFGSGATVLSTAVLSGPDALSIDSKIDDGVANSGNVLAIQPNATSGSDCNGATPGSTYTVASGSKKVCALSFRVDVSS